MIKNEIYTYTDKVDRTIMLKSTVERCMKTLNALKQDIYSHIIKSDHEVGDAK